jgi:hypothetical protein
MVGSMKGRNMEIDQINHWQAGIYTLSRRGYEYIMARYARPIVGDWSSSPIIARDASWYAVCEIVDWDNEIIQMNYYPLSQRWPKCAVYELTIQANQMGVKRHV